MNALRLSQQLLAITLIATILASFVFLSFIRAEAGDADVTRDRNLQEPIMQPGNADVIRDRNGEFLALVQNNADVIRDHNLRSCELADNDLEITDSKVVQVVSDPKTVVMNKKAAICVTVVNSFAERKWVFINVTYNFGNRSYLEVGPYGNGTPVDLGINRVYIPGGPIFNQTSLVRNAWMSPDSGDYLYWNMSGTDATIKVRIDPSNQISETNESNNEKTMSKKIARADDLSILFIPVNFKNDENKNRFMDSDRQSLDLQVQRWVNFIRGVYPASEVRSYMPWPPYQAPELPGILTKQWLYISVVDDLVRDARITGYDRVVVLVKNLKRFYWGEELLGRIQIAEAIGMGWVPETREPVVVDPIRPEAWSEWLMAHELGHTYYLWHPWDIGPNRNESQRFWVEDRDYERNMTTMMRYDYGQDVWLDEGRYENDTKETVNIFWQRWNLLDQFKTGTDPEIVMMSGVLYRNGTVRNDYPWYRMESSGPQMSSGDSGNYSVVLLDSGSQILARFYFNASFTYYTDVGGNLTAGETDGVPFRFDVAFQTGTSIIEIRNSADQVLLSRAVSQNPPVVDISSPNGGEVLTAGMNCTISWNSSDLDGDNLTYSVAYSKSGGGEWVPLVSGLTQTSYVWDTSYLEPGTSYLAKVIATDGVNTGEDSSSSTFTVLDSTPPTIEILSPQNKVYYSNAVALTLKISEPVSWIGYSLDDLPNVTVNGYVTLSVQDGSHQIAAYANDTSGNMGICSRSYFFVDSTLYDPWKSSFIGLNGYPIVDFASYAGKLYCVSNCELYVLEGNSWYVVDAPAYITSIEPYGNMLVMGAANALYSYDGAVFRLIFAVPSYIKALGVYNNTLYAGTMLDKPPVLYYCKAMPDLPSSWYVDASFSNAMNFSGPFGSIDSFAEFNGNLYVTSGGTIFRYNGTGWSVVKQYDDVWAFLDMHVYKGELFLATRDEGWRKPMFLGGSGFSGRVIEFDGDNWTTILDHDYWIYSLEVYDNKLYAGTANKILTYDGTNWTTSFNTLEEAYYCISFTVFDGKIFAGMGNGYIFADPLSESVIASVSTRSMMTQESSYDGFKVLYIVSPIAVTAIFKRRSRRKLEV